MNIPGFGGNAAVLGGAIVAAITAALALLFGGSFLIQGAPQSLSSAQSQSNTAGGTATGGANDGGSGDSDGGVVGTPRSGDSFSAVLPDGAVAVGKATAEQLLQGDLKGVTFTGQTVSVFKDGSRSANTDYPFFVSGSDGCNEILSPARIADDGTLQFAGDREISSAECSGVPGIGVFGEVFRSGASIYTLGDPVFLKRGDIVLEFARA